MTMPAWNKRPKNPSKWDDEFEADRMHPKWFMPHVTTIPPLEEHVLDPHQTTGSDNWENAHRHKVGWWCRQGISTASNLQGYTQDISDLPDECTIIFRGGRGMRRALAVDGDSEIMVRISDDIYSNYVLIMWDSFTSIYSPLFARSSPSQGLGYLNIGLVRNYFSYGEPVEYMAVTKAGLRWDGWAASSGGHWLWLGSHTHILTMTRMTVTFNNGTTSAPGNSLGGLDFVRVLPGLNLP